MNVWTRADAPPARPMAAVVLDFVTQPFTQERFAVVAEPVRAPSLWSPERLADHPVRPVGGRIAA